MTDTPDFVQAFRGSSPYINAHRGKTFVISFAGEAIAGENFHQHIQDIALLHGLGIRIILIHGIRPQIEARLERAGIDSRYHNNIRITDQYALECVKEAAGIVRVELEADFSMGLPNTPMAGAKIRVVSGNFVTAQPIGVRDGVDFRHTGQVRRIDTQGIIQQLQLGHVVVMPPIGYSPSGDVFNLTAEDVATHVAAALHADKLIVMLEPEQMQPLTRSNFKQLTTSEIETWLAEDTSLGHDFRLQMMAAVRACQDGVTRVHLINRMQDGSLLQELFTRDGIGTLITQTPFEVLRPATQQDINGILDLIKPLQDKGMLVPRSRETLETELREFTVIERDGLVIGCAALHAYPKERQAELACLALHQEYRGESRGERLLQHMEALATSKGVEQLFVLTTQSLHWFVEHGFSECDASILPAGKRQKQDPARNSKILAKSMTE